MSCFARGMLAALAALSMITAARAAAGDCYQLEDDGTFGTHQDWTITDTDGIEMIWNRGGDKVVLMTGPAGTGMPNRIADEPDQTRHIYRYLDDMLLFDMNIYYRGCPDAPAKPIVQTNDRCFVSEEDPSWTLTEGESVGKSGYIWKQGDKEVLLETNGQSIGKGRMAQSATEPDGTEHAYLQVERNLIVMDMTPYDRGCPK